MKQSIYSKAEWGLFAAALILPVFAWGQYYQWSIGSLNGYQWFPLFGMIAWMMMWTHYVSGALRITQPKLKKSKLYGKISAYIVLLALLLHPGILALEQLQAGQGIPPQSFINYVGEGLKIAVLLGSLSLVIFLSFEVFDRMKDKIIIKRNWKWISVTQSLAMTLIFVHSLRLGSTVSDGWFMIVWYVCGVSLLPCFYLIHRVEFSDKGEENA